MALSVLWGEVEPVARRNFLLTGTVAVAMLGLYGLLAWRYPLVQNFDNPRASWASMVDPTWVNAIQHLFIYLGLILLYLVAMQLLVPSRKSGRYQIPFIVFIWLACSSVLMLVSPAGESHDIFDYLFRGRLITEYHANPLVDVPESFGLSMPYTRYLAWRKNVDTYGPVWEASSAGVAYSVHRAAAWFGWWNPTSLVCPESTESCRLLIMYVTGYRLLAIILTGFSAWLIASIVRRNQAEFVPLALVAWLWNPLLLISTALGGHNDAVMLVLLLLSLWLLQHQRLFWAVMALILAAHVKLTALIWLPTVAFWIIWRHGWRQALKIGLASMISVIILSWLLYAPFGGWQTLPRMLQERSVFLANSPWQALQYLLIEKAGWSSWKAYQLSTRLPNWLFMIGALMIPSWMFNFRPKRWRMAPIIPYEADQILWRAMIAVSMIYLLVGSFWFQHWYILWVLVPAVLLSKSHFTRSLLPWLVFGALSSNMFMSFFLAAKVKEPNLTLPLANYFLPVLIIWGPFFIAAAYSKFIGQRHRSDLSVKMD